MATVSEIVVYQRRVRKQPGQTVWHAQGDSPGVWAEGHTEQAAVEALRREYGWIDGVADAPVRRA